MQLIDIINVIKRMGSKSPKLFRAIQFASFGTAVVCAVVLLLSKAHMINLPNPEAWEYLLMVLISSGVGSGTTASATTTNPTLIGHEVKNNIINFNDKCKTMETITGYKADLPEGAANATLNSVNGEDYNIAVPDYAGATYFAETATDYGMYVWDASTEITSLIINGEGVPVQPVLNGAHPTQKPK